MAVAEELIVVIRAEVNNAVANLNKAKTATQGLQKKFIGLVAGIGASYLTFRTLKKVLEESFEMAKYAAQVSQVEVAFKNMAESVGEDSVKIVEDLKRMSLGTIDKLNLIKGASRAALFDIPLDKLDELMKISMASATATGESVQYMFDSIVTGIGRASPLILDNLGLQLKVDEATEAYAKSLGKSADSLTMIERKQAILNTVLEAGGEIMKKVGKVANEATDAQRVDQYKAAMADLRGEIGESLLPAFRALTKVATQFLTDMKDAIELRNIMREVNKGTATLADQLKLVNAQLEEYAERRRDPGEFGPWVTEKEIDLLKQRKVAIEQQMGAIQFAEKMRTETAKAAAADAAAEVTRLARLQEYLKIVREAYAKTDAGQKEALNSQIAFWEDTLKTAAQTRPQIVAILKELYDKFGELNGRLDSTIEVTSEFVDEIVGGFSTVSREALGLTGIMDGFIDSLTGEGKLQEAIDQYEEFRDTGEMVYETMMKHVSAFKALKEAIAKAKEEQKKFDEEQEKLKKIMEGIYTETFTAFAQAFADTAIEGGNVFKEAFKAAIATVLQALAKLAIGQAALAAASLQFVKAAALLGVATTLLVAAGAVKAMKEGGWITEPIIGKGQRTGTTYSLGEAGPEYVTPAGKMGAAQKPSITIQNYIRGSLITERQLTRQVASDIGRQLRGY